MSGERLAASLDGFGLDGRICVELLASSFGTLNSNPERLKLAKEFLTDSGISAQDLTKLLPVISRFVVDFGSGSIPASASASASPEAPSENKKPPSSSPVQEEETTGGGSKQTKKKTKTVIRGKDLAEFFAFKTPNYVQQYSDDEKNPKPKISVLKQPLVVVQQPKPQISVVNRPAVVAPAPWSAPQAPPTPPSAKPVTPPVTARKLEETSEAAEYGGFW